MPTPHQEILVLNTLKYYQAEYKEGVPLSILKLELDLDDDQLHEVIHAMKSKGTINLASGKVNLIEAESPEESVEEIKLAEELPEVPEKIESPEISKDELATELSETELESLELIRSLADESGVVARHILEGHLLHGDLKLSNLRVYNLINSLQNKGLLTRTQRTDGAYYRLLGP
jgi:sugar-specific transcriptional regulator TrmB